MPTTLGILHFAEHYVERIWGGRRLNSSYGKPLPPDIPIGEAWLVSDHPSAESLVDEGPHAGTSLNALMRTHGPALLGTAAAPTIHNRFPLLLKLLDSTDYLSVQVHPDDDCALRLGEPDVGKTEMWHVLDSLKDGKLFCGLDPNATPDSLVHAIKSGALEALLPSFAVQPGDSIFVPAGSIHAIGPGLVLAEIQQNSDLTYRLYDWGRVQADGSPRTLHIDKSVQATHFGERHPGKSPVLSLQESCGKRTVLAACRYFAAERLELDGAYVRQTRLASFHIILALSGNLTVEADSSSRAIAPSECVLVPALEGSFSIYGRGACIDYYVPELTHDLVLPLRNAGHPDADIARLVHNIP